MNLVTGATGIVGLRIVYDLLKRKQQVRALQRSSSDMAFAEKVLRFYGAQVDDLKNIHWFEGDLLDIFSLEKALEGIKTVYHCAALVSYDSKDEKKLFQINEGGTKNLVNTCLTSEVDTICHISSVAALGVEKEGFTTEESHWQRDDNRSVYGLTKYLAERELWRAGAEGLNVVAVNPSIILGPSKPDQSSGMLLNILRKGSKYYPTGGVGLVDVRDVSEACITAVEKRKYGERFLLNSENLSFRDLLSLAAEIFGQEKPKTKLPDFLLELAWRFGLITRLFGIKTITKETARSAQRQTNYESSKAKHDLGMEFIPVGETLDWIKDF
ncbi:MAG TPA: NAD-dependent epimerase/dehydratase family protein [Cryomorphaceae bacterium]|nr:NAD-dependent epimerase/dehydratase family protein [Cryomorphaceae bacterium]